MDTIAIFILAVVIGAIVLFAQAQLFKLAKSVSLMERTVRNLEIYLRNIENLLKMQSGGSPD